MSSPSCPRASVSVANAAEARPTWARKVDRRKVSVRVRNHAQTLADGLADPGYTRHKSPDPSHGSGIVTVDLEQPEARFEQLQAHGITGALRAKSCD